jgi:hypothetical protein
MVMAQLAGEAAALHDCTRATMPPPASLAERLLLLLPLLLMLGLLLLIRASQADRSSSRATGVTLRLQLQRRRRAGSAGGPGAVLAPAGGSIVRRRLQHSWQQPADSRGVQASRQLYCRQVILHAQSIQVKLIRACVSKQTSERLGASHVCPA